MRISTYTPKLTVAEADRCWMMPLDVCELAIIGDATKPEVRRFLNNVSDRGYIPFVKSGDAKTSPKLYSCVSAISMRCFREITVSGRPYEFAAPIAAHVADLSRKLIAEYANLNELDIDGPDWFVVYSCSWSGKVESIRTVRAAKLNPGEFFGSYDHGVFSAGDVIWNVLRHYPDYWARDRIARGQDQPAGRYDGCDANGKPLDPAHPWNSNLPPLKRAKRLVEIEEYITKRDADRAKEDDTS